MAEAITETLYIRLRKQLKLDGRQPILLGQVAQMIVALDLEQQLKSIVLYEPNDRDGNMVLIDMMMVVQKVNALFPTMKIEHFGDPSTLLEIASAPRRIPFLLLGFVWFILFIGSGLAIMNFHADVSMLEVHQRFYELLTGKHNEHPYLLQIPYSIGLGLGMLLFFNHIFRKKFNEEPSPLEVEMFMYQQNMNQYMVMNEYAKKSSRKGQQKEEQE